MNLQPVLSKTVHAQQDFQGAVHITATLYCLKDYIHLGLQDDEQKGCTERLQTWNQPRKENDRLIQGQQMKYSLLKRSMELKRELRHIELINGTVSL